MVLLWHFYIFMRWGKWNLSNIFFNLPSLMTFKYSRLLWFGRHAVYYELDIVLLFCRNSALGKHRIFDQHPEKKNKTSIAENLKICTQSARKFKFRQIIWIVMNGDRNSNYVNGYCNSERCICLSHHNFFPDCSSYGCKYNFNFENCSCCLQRCVPFASLVPWLPVLHRLTGSAVWLYAPACPRTGVTPFTSLSLRLFHENKTCPTCGVR